MNRFAFIKSAMPIFSWINVLMSLKLIYIVNLR